ncbi:MAG: 30S ribosomal protein S2 [Bauldia litoralis]|uniref:30S ribosomal protein S2 n=1 Tax=Bauldia litoralis TaxID=665467 RepID=UPI0032994EEE
MALPDFTMRQLLEAGVHFGHQKHRWNPKMAPFIFGVRNNIHVIDLAQTVPMLHRALQTVSDSVAQGGRVLFVGTKRQATDPVAAAATRCAQYYVNSRWLGGMLTNWKTMSRSIQRLREVDEVLSGEATGLTKKERLTLTRERDKLEKALGGIKDMGGVPDLIFVIDTNKEAIAIKEANRLGIPIAAVVDSNCDPDNIQFPIPGNDDAGRAITLYCDLIARAAIDGISRAQGDSGLDVGAAEEVLEPVLAEAAPVNGAGDVTMAQAEAVEPPSVETPRPAAAEAPAAAEPAAAVPAAAEPAAEEEEQTGPLFVTPEGEPDDLKKISGVGPVLEQKLNSLGITKLDQVANFTDEEIEKVDDALNFKGRIQRDDWIGQAKTLIGEA